MQRLRGLPRRFRFPWRSFGQIHREIDDEIRFHLDRRSEELERLGWPAAAARQEARRLFGDVDAARRSLRAAGRRGEQGRRRQVMFGDLWRDLRFAARSLWKSPGFTAVAVIVLALGIGANSAIFSLLNMLLMRPLHLERPEELVGIYRQSLERPDSYRSFSYPAYLDIRRQGGAFSELAAFTVAIVGVAEGDVTRRVMAGVVSESYFRAFGVPPTIGRAFTPAEERPAGGAAVAVLSHDSWTRRGAPRDVIGSTLRINGHVVTVVGVAARGFTGSTAVFSPELWLPLGFYDRVSGPPGSGGAPATIDDRRSYPLMLFGRLRPGVTGAAAELELGALASRLQEAYPIADADQTFVVAPLPRLAISNQPGLENVLIAPSLLLIGMTGVVLLIASLNLANMLVARGVGRRAELAIRLSLGGGRARLVRQFLTEGLVLALSGGLGGLLLAYWASGLLLSSLGNLLPVGLTVLFDVSPDWRVILATVALCVLATLLFALGPAWRLTSGDLVATLKVSAARGLSGGRRRGPLAPRNLLIVAQIALSLVLLTAGGLFLRAALTAADATPGFRLDRSALVELDPSLVGRDEAASRETYRRVVEHLRALPGVEAAGLASIVPFGSVTITRRVEPAGPSDAATAVPATYTIIGDDYFASLRLPVLRGRGPTASEVAPGSGPSVAIIDQPLAERLFPDQDPIGRHLQIAATAPGVEPVAMEVVGLVPGVRHRLWDEAPSPHLYVPYGQAFSANMSLHLAIDERLARDEARLLETLRAEIRAVDPALPVLAMKTLRTHRDESIFLWLVQAAAKVFSALGALALFLALVGVYGVKAFVMSQRTREIGIRMALGATRGSVLRQMVSESLSLTIAAVALGLLLSVGVAHLLSSLLYRVSAVDPLVFLTAPLLLAAAATLAAYLPARRATRIAPTTALRHE